MGLIKKFSFKPLTELEVFDKMEGAELNKAKAFLAYEITELVHGKEEADKAKAASEAAFGGAASENMPGAEIDAADVDSITVLDYIAKAKLVPSKGEGRRLIEQGGVSVNDKKVASAVETVCADDFSDGSIIVKKGKKVFYKIILE